MASNTPVELTVDGTSSHEPPQETRQEFSEQQQYRPKVLNLQDQSDTTGTSVPTATSSTTSINGNTTVSIEQDDDVEETNLDNFPRMQESLDQSQSLTESISQSLKSELHNSPSSQSLSSFSPSKPVVRILVVGLTGHGKSSLINTLVGRDVAEVAHGAKACQHKEHVMKYESNFNGTTLYIFDTRGLGDGDIKAKDIFKEIRHELEEVDLMLICHKLFERAEKATKRMLQRIISQCGKRLLNRSVLCYTKADEYKTSINTQRVSRESKAAYIKAEINNQVASLTTEIKQVLIEVLTEEEFNRIPTCLTSDRSTHIPTSPYWMGTFWGHCITRCDGDAAKFLNWFGRNRTRISHGAVMGGAGIVSGATVGGIVGGLVGTGLMPVPGFGTGAGMVVGSVIGGAAVGVVGGMGLEKAVKKVIHKTKEKGNN